MGVLTTATINAPIEDIWHIISDFGGLKRWHPAVERCEVTGSGEGAVRTVHFSDWWVAEKLVKFEPLKHVIGYAVIDSSRPSSIGVEGTMTLSRIDDVSSEIEWTSGLPDENPDAAEVNARLASYYPKRIKDLMDALGI